MTSCPPPYRPLRGAEPPHFVDREDPQDVVANGILAASIAAYAAGPCDPRFHRLIIAEPAMGKTTLLRAIAKAAVRRLGWAVALHSCRPKERALRAVATVVANILHQQWPTDRARLESEMGDLDNSGQSVFPGLESGSSWAFLKRLLESAGHLARANSRGLLVVFDETDRLSGGELESLGYLARSLSRDGLPVALLFGGGPQLGERFARVGNFSGCIWPTNLGCLDDGEAREALVVPAADRGVEFHSDALELLCLAAGGSPFEIQRLGFAAWSAAGGAELVALTDARAALSLVIEAAEARAS
jgi:hypothetical protein